MKTLIAIIVGIVILAGGFYLFQQMRTTSSEDLAVRENSFKEKVVEIETTEKDCSEVCTEDASVGPVLPQIFFRNAVSFPEAEQTEIRGRIVEPFVAFHKCLLQHPVSFVIERNESPISDIKVEVITARDLSSDEAISTGFLYTKEGGHYPLWQPDLMGPGAAEACLSVLDRFRE